MAQLNLQNDSTAASVKRKKKIENFTQNSCFEFISLTQALVWISCWLYEQHPMLSEGHKHLAVRRKTIRSQVNQMQSPYALISPVEVELWHGSLPHLVLAHFRPPATLPWFYLQARAYEFPELSDNRMGRTIFEPYTTSTA